MGCAKSSPYTEEEKGHVKEETIGRERDPLRRGRGGLKNW